MTAHAENRSRKSRKHRCRSTVCGVGGSTLDGRKEGERSNKRRLDRRRPSAGSNNSMPMADKAYDAPEPPEEVEAFLPGLAEPAINYRQAFRPKIEDVITLHLRVRKRNFEPLLWQLISNGTFKKGKMYSEKNLPYWTLGMRFNVRVNLPMGRLMEMMRHRLGLTCPGVKFCLDGFFGMINYTDVFGNTAAGACPWMEISDCSTVKSLCLHEGDSIFVSIASYAQIEAVQKWRKKQSFNLVLPGRKSVGPRASARERESAGSLSTRFKFPGLDEDSGQKISAVQG